MAIKRIGVTIPAPRGHRTMYLVTASGRKYSLGLSPAGGSGEISHKFGTIERPGDLDVTRGRGRNLRTIEFEHTLASGDPTKSIDSKLKSLASLAESGAKVKISGGSGVMEGGRWWTISKLSVEIEQRATNNGVSAATLSWAFTEFVDVTTKLITPKPKSKKSATKKSSGKSKTSTAKRVHTVKRGDTLSKISKKYYKSALKWRKIYAANKKIMKKGPNVLAIGWKLTIPK